MQKVMNEIILGVARSRCKFLLRSLLMAVWLCMPLVASADANLQFSHELAISPSGQWGQPVYVSISVKNYGNAASGAFGVKLFLQGIYWTTVPVKSLPLNTGTNYNVLVNLPNPIPNGLASTGRFSVRQELPKGIMSGLSYINVSLPYPDLTGSNGGTDFGSFRVDKSSAIWGQTIRVNWVVANQTPGKAGSFSVGIYLSKTKNFSANDPKNCKLIALRDMRSMEGNSWNGGAAKQGGVANIKLPSANPFDDGTTVFYIGMAVDPYNQIPETNEANNANQGASLDMVDQPLVIYNQPIIQAAPSSVAFGSVDVDGVDGAVGTQNVTIVNNGSQPLNISGISTTGGPFLIKSISSNLQSLSQPVTSGSVKAFSAESWIVNLSFDPTVTGTQSGTLTINSNDPANPVTTVPLSGVGEQLPRISFLDPVAPTNDFMANHGSIANDGSGGVSSTQVFTLTNLGSGPLTISQNGISLTDTASGVWSLVSITSNTRGTINLSATSATIAPNNTETWSVAVKFDPVANASYATGLQVVSNDRNQGTLTCTLNGAGATPMKLSAEDSIGVSNDRTMNFGPAHATGNDKRTGTVTLRTPANCR